MSESKRIQSHEKVIYTESEYQALKKEIALLTKAHEDISQLLVTGKWSDVTITVDGKNFALHRTILSARSPIFAYLLEANCKENCLVIDDVPVGVFEVLLGFIYTGKVPSLEPQMAENLLATADKYHLGQLKSAAEDYLCAGLSLESATSLYSLATIVNASKLKGKCMELIHRHASSSTTPPFAHLPDRCLLVLFRQLPPADQLSARKVCHRWSVLVSSANRRHPHSLALFLNCSRNFAEIRLNARSHGPHWELLKLLKNENGSPLVSIQSLTKWNSLQLSSLDEETISQIVTTFPIVKKLQLFAEISMSDNGGPSNTPPPDLLVRLLEQWRPQLTALNLDVQFRSSSENLLRPSLDRLATAINSLPVLKHLTINLFINNEPFIPDLAVLSQLTAFNTSLNFRQFRGMLGQYVPESSSESMQMNFGSYEATANQLTSLGPDLRRRIVGFGNRHSDFRIICGHLKSLTSVYLELSTTTLHEFLTAVSQLTQLVHLQLSVDFSRILQDNQPLPQLTSVKLLGLHFNDQPTRLRLQLQSHTNLERLNLTWTMPNVQVIHLGLDPLQCTTCGISNRSSSDRKRKYCLREMFTYLKRHCSKLNSIRHDLEDSLGTAETILAERYEGPTGREQGPSSTFSFRFSNREAPPQPPPRQGTNINLSGTKMVNCIYTSGNSQVNAGNININSYN